MQSCSHTYCQLCCILTGIPHLTDLHFTVLCKHCLFFFFFFFYKLKACSNCALSKSIGTIFSTASVHFLSVCNILLILTVFPTFFTIIIFVMMIYDQQETRKVLAQLTNLNYQQETGFKIHSEGRKDISQNPGDSLLHLFTMKVNGKLLPNNIGMTITGTYPFRMKVWVTPPGIESQNQHGQ